ncbi:MAG: fused MFS/spermidine synthase [Pseudomonadota bacterium]
MYEILWMRQLAQLLGSTSQSAAVTTAAFFMGLAAGSHFFGKRAARLTNPLRTYALLEFGIVLAGLFYFLLFQLYFQIYSLVFEAFSGSELLFGVVKMLLAMLLICPASFLMGGTLPVMGEYLVKDRQQLGRWAGTLYGINTLGAVLGAIAAGFFLPRQLGLNITYSIALSLSFTLGAITWLLAKAETSKTPSNTSDRSTRLESPTVLGQFGFIEFVALLSGFLSLAMQVLWVRMFVQVLQNSTYTFSAVLVVFLSALAMGAFLVRLLNARMHANLNTLLVLLAISAVACLSTPFIFIEWTNGLRYLGNQDQLGSYLLQVLFTAGVIVGIPTLLMGMVLPYLYRYAESLDETPGATLGRLNGWNTIGAVVGPLVASFVMLPMLGLWNSVLLIGMAYLAVPLVRFENPSARVVTVACLALLLVFFNPAHLPLVRINEAKERLLALWEGADGTVAVVEKEGNRRIKLNNWYALGGSSAQRMEQIQTHLPMHLHPNPKSVFYLGMGSGITAGTVLNYPIENATIAELSAEVIQASAQYFGEYSNNFHQHPSVNIVHEDGRNYLAGTQNTYDLIIADLFIPWRAGVALLYTREHFQRAKSRLNSGGLFVQWVPLYQISERELKIIVNTMASSFPMVSLWRGDFYANKPIMALVGHPDTERLDTDTRLVKKSLEALAAMKAGTSEQIPLLAYYLGRVEQSDPWLQGVPVNTDNLPIIEFLAPESHRAERAGLIEWFTGEQMISFMQQLQQTNEPAQDIYLSALSVELRQAAYAGLFFHIAAVAKQQGKESASRDAAKIGKELLFQADP